MQRPLTDAGIGRAVRIVSADLDPDVASWLDALGLHEGERVVVLRSAAFGGPLHVRTGSGGEFAVARELAARLRVSDDDDEER